MCEFIPEKERFFLFKFTFKMRYKVAKFVVSSPFPCALGALTADKATSRMAKFALTKSSVHTIIKHGKYSRKENIFDVYLVILLSDPKSLFNYSSFSWVVQSRRHL